MPEPAVETKPDTTTTTAPAANTTTTATPDKTTTTAPAAAAPKPGTDPAAPAADPAPDAETDVGEGGEAGAEGDTVVTAGDKAEGEPAADADKDKPAADAADKDKDKAAPPNWAKQREDAADKHIERWSKKNAKQLSTDKDGKPLTQRQRQAILDDERERYMAVASRYKSPEAVLDALVSAQRELSSRKRGLPEDPTDEELAAYREDNGIPADPTGYKVANVQEGEKPNIEKFLGRMHEKNASQAQVDAALATYRELVTEAKEAHERGLKERDKKDAAAARDDLRDEYKPSIELLNGLWKDPAFFPEELREQIAEARLPDGQRLANNADYMRLFRDIAMYGIAYPNGVDGAFSKFEPRGDGPMLTGDQAAAASSEEAELIRLRDTNIDEYRYRPWKNTGMTGSERLLEIQRKKEQRGGRRAA